MTRAMTLITVAAAGFMIYASASAADIEVCLPLPTNCTTAGDDGISTCIPDASISAKIRSGLTTLALRRVEFYLFAIGVNHADIVSALRKESEEYEKTKGIP